MRFKPAIWRPIAIALSALNLAGIVWAASEAEPAHAAVHAMLAVLFALWTQRLRPGTSEPGPESARIESVESDMLEVRREVYELQERLDFAERLLAQSVESRRATEEPGTR